MTEQINYEELLPVRPAEDVVSFACESGAFEKQYLIYRSERVYEPLEDRMRDAARVSCTACGRRFHAEKINAGGCHPGYAPAPFGWWNDGTNEQVISGNHTLCPCCGAKAVTVHIGNMRLYGGELVDDAFVSVLSRLPVEDRKDRLVLTAWCVRRCINKQAETRFEIWPYTAWVVEERKVVRLMGYAKIIGSAVSLFGRWKQRKTFCDVYGEMQLLMPWNKALLEGATAANCKLDLYLKAGGKRLVSYLALWRKHSAVENLLVQGCGRLVRSWINDETSDYTYGGGIPKLPAVNWKEKRPARMLGLNREEFRHLASMGWSADDLSVYKQVRDAGLAVRLPEDMELLRSRKPYEINKILHEAKQADFWRTVRYLARQGKDFGFLRDYWSMAEGLGWDLGEDLVRWPRDLSAAHDRAMDLQKAKENAALCEQFAQRAEALDRLSFASEGLLIRPCASEAELICEGRDLHHCVALYAKDHANGRTAILFIRRAERPDEPFFTLEFDEKTLTVRQNRGLRNCARTPEVEAFEKAWLAWVKAEAAKKARVRVA